jgi:glycosyltransferase involved in cell wall biosynthesis
MRNEARQLGSFLEPLKEFLDRGGDLTVLDTGSTDGTPQILHDAGAHVTQVAPLSISVTVSEVMAKAINDELIDPSEPPLVMAGTVFFDFSEARNMAARLSHNDMLLVIDADEKVMRLDIDKVGEMVAAGYENMEMDYVTKSQGIHFFMGCRWLDRRKFHFEGIMHELICGTGKKGRLDPSVCSVEHRPEPNTNRGKYLEAMAYMLYVEPDRCRQTHWLARDLIGAKRYKSAIRLFLNHVTMPDCTRGEI